MQGFYFCPATYQPRTSACNGLSAIHAINYTATMQKAFTGLYMCVSGNLTHSTAYNTRPAKADITPPATRWRAYRQALHLHRYPIPPPRRTLYRAVQPPYYNKVYRGAAVRPVMGQCQTAQHIADHASPAGSASPPVQCQPDGLRSGTGQRSGRTGWHTPPGGCSPVEGAGGTTGGSSPLLFSAFRPIANRGQQ